ncbi:MAG: prolyl oligopeptidase family serine peptidase, partial [Gammaproteobacteria bacterium]
MTSDSSQPSREVEALVSRMARVGFCILPSFSPDGEMVAFVSTLSGLPQIWTVPVAGGWPTQITALDDQVQRAAWSPRGDWIACAISPRGGLNVQVYLMRPDGTEMHCITDGGRTNNWLGRFNGDGTLLAIRSNRRDASAVDAWVYDIDRASLELVATNPGIGGLTEIGPGNRTAVLHRVNSRSDSDLFLVDLETHEELHLTPHDGPGSFGEGQFAADDEIYLTSDAGRDRVALVRLKIADHRIRSQEIVVERDDADVQEFELSPDRTEAAVLWNVAGRNALEFVDLRNGARRAGPTLPAEIVLAPRFSADGRYLAFTASGAARPADVWVLITGSNALRQLTKSPHAGIVLDDLVRPELVEFETHDGLALSGWLYKPRGKEGPMPMVLSFHGGPEAQERPIFNSNYQALLTKGIGVFAPNVRGSSGFGKRFVNLDNGALRFDGIRDIESCVKCVVEREIADPERIGIMGGSYGGYMTMVGLTFYPELFAAGANLYGIVNFETFFEHTEPWMAAISKIKYGDPD